MKAADVSSSLGHVRWLRKIIWKAEKDTDISRPIISKKKFQTKRQQRLFLSYSIRFCLIS